MHQLTEDTQRKCQPARRTSAQREHWPCGKRHAFERRHCWNQCCGWQRNGNGWPHATRAIFYPTHADYVDKYTRAADQALSAGFLLEEDHKNAVERAKSAPIPN